MAPQALRAGEEPTTGMVVLPPHTYTNDCYVVVLDEPSRSVVRCEAVTSCFGRQFDLQGIKKGASAWKKHPFLAWCTAMASWSWFVSYSALVSA